MRGQFIDGPRRFTREYLLLISHHCPERGAV